MVVSFVIDNELNKSMQLMSNNELNSAERVEYSVHALPREVMRNVRGNTL